MAKRRKANVVITACECCPRSGKSASLSPSSRRHSRAAAVPLSGLTAWQALFDHAGLTKGQSILIHGAAGGVGTFAVQLARWCGAHVIGTAQARNADLVYRLGADELIDYTSVPFEDRVRDIDVVLDRVGGDTLGRSWRVVRPGGVFVTIAGSAPADKAKRYGVRGVDFIVKSSRAELVEIRNLIEAGHLSPVIEDTVPREKAREAFKRCLGGHNRGKLVL